MLRNVRGIHNGGTPIVLVMKFSLDDYVKTSRGYDVEGFSSSDLSTDLDYYRTLDDDSDY
jgi:hypothetical protein